MAKEIELTSGEIALVDDSDFENLIKFSWRAAGTGKTKYAIRQYGTGRKRKTIRMHRQLLNITETYRFVDHINGNGLDNRRENLRICFHKENMRNMSLSVKNTTGYKGVHFYKRVGVFQAYIYVNYKKKHLGTFLTAKDAAITYNKAAKNLHGKFARLNDEI